MISTGHSMFLLVVIIPPGCFVPAGSYGLCWWLRVPAGRHTSAGGFISTMGSRSSSLDPPNDGHYAPAGAAAGGDAADEANVVANDAIGG
nr:hypothetical protein [Tanacetum cinerariifolium]